MKQPAGSPPHEVRILGGQWKRSKLPVADRPGLRPTPSRVRETLFNWLGQDLTGWRVIDAFAGTGALGFEAASRGAHEALLLEQDPALAAQLQAVRTRLKAETVRVQRGDGLAALRAAAGQGWNAVFLDPPFDATALFEPALRAAAAAIGPEGFVYLEAPRPWSEAELAALGLALHRHGRAGAVAFHLLRPLAG
ncbi:MAG: 16S rRNA (guanine(966)-N(2))-methyltransferase RsmD [Hydrogenophaga sp.]|uniref:16S rRNA (guanine(966)-N(2))-methyltransferase RsmD n=1 Tax=Hydrogenophaga sp. TaxID=1904254 RepID=UPI00257A0B03|nr:16S rRNA (guanine(966)-N(2))-methyltransferase RsmD [Hydrogenophaga sp.]MBL0946339.1 16S rRNA (guanine(966)-N(2))-methyltransferase RsmD [Hydrogenophaga sp.]